MEKYSLNQVLIRKGLANEVYHIIEKKMVNNILHYVLKSQNSSDVILSCHAIDKDFLTETEFSIFKKKRSFAETFRKKISNLIS
tara:strand:- start:40 stop:291 length:252 start_codon:yes stop_codon:yes gene_type:complete